jgi:hypothetical protein
MGEIIWILNVTGLFSKKLEISGNEEEMETKIATCENCAFWAERGNRELPDTIPNVGITKMKEELS